MDTVAWTHDWNSDRSHAFQSDFDPFDLVRPLTLRAPQNIAKTARQRSPRGIHLIEGHIRRLEDPSIEIITFPSLFFYRT